MCGKLKLATWPSLMLQLLTCAELLAWCHAPRHPLRSYDLPLAELGGDFYDELKGVSSGYASFDYEEGEYRRGCARQGSAGGPSGMPPSVHGCATAAPLCEWLRARCAAGQCS